MMNFQKYLANQLGKPTGIVGKYILGALWNNRNSRLNDLTVEQLELLVEDRILDVGFGGGYLLGKIIQKTNNGFVAGIDISQTMVDNCRKYFQKEIINGKVDIKCASSEMLPYPEKYFTKVSSVNSIFYWANPKKGISEIYRVLINNGKFILTFTTKTDLSKNRFVQYGVKTFDAQDIQRMMEAAGFKNIISINSKDQYREFICLKGTK
jgi:arsenite methyltransferase